MPNEKLYSAASVFFKEPKLAWTSAGFAVIGAWSFLQIGLGTLQEDDIISQTLFSTAAFIISVGFMARAVYKTKMHKSPLEEFPLFPSVSLETEKKSIKNIFSLQPISTSTKNKSFSSVVFTKYLYQIGATLITKDYAYTDTGFSLLRDTNVFDFIPPTQSNDIKENKFQQIDALYKKLPKFVTQFPSSNPKDPFTAKDPLHALFIITVALDHLSPIDIFIALKEIKKTDRNIPYRFSRVDFPNGSQFLDIHATEAYLYYYILCHPEKFDFVTEDIYAHETDRNERITKRIGYRSNDFSQTKKDICDTILSTTHLMACVDRPSESESKSIKDNSVEPFIAHKELIFEKLKTKDEKDQLKSLTFETEISIIFENKKRANDFAKICQTLGIIFQKKEANKESKKTAISLSSDYDLYTLQRHIQIEKLGQLAVKNKYLLKCVNIDFLREILEKYEIDSVIVKSSEFMGARLYQAELSAQSLLKLEKQLNLELQPKKLVKNATS